MMHLKLMLRDCDDQNGHAPEPEAPRIQSKSRTHELYMQIDYTRCYRHNETIEI